MLPPARDNLKRTSATVRVALSVSAWIIRATPPGAKASYRTSTYSTPSSSPVPFLIARSMLSLGMDDALGGVDGGAEPGVPAGVAAALLAATVISRMTS
jgi:hypothetical protein